MPRAAEAGAALPPHNGTWRAASHAAPRVRAHQLVVLTTMQWFGGSTWGRTLRRCGPRAPQPRRGPQVCVRTDELVRRQLELIEVLRRNVLHPAVAEVHVLVAEALPVRALLSRLPWYSGRHPRRHSNNSAVRLRRGNASVHLVETGERPSFRSYVSYLNASLTGRLVVITNQDVFLEGPHWSRIRLPPKSVYFLSRYHQRVTYHDDAAHAAAAAGALGLGPINSSAFGGRGGRGAGHTRTTCDMTTSEYRKWHQSLCNTANWGAYDAYVIRLERHLGAAEIDLFNYPQNAWGGENVFLHIWRDGFGYRATNPCLSLRVVHMHCALPTQFGVHIVGDKRLGKKLVAEGVKTKLEAMGIRTGMDAGEMGKITLPVTRLPGGLLRTPAVSRTPASG